MLYLFHIVDIPARLILEWPFFALAGLPWPSMVGFDHLCGTCCTPYCWRKSGGKRLDWGDLDIRYVQREGQRAAI